MPSRTSILLSASSGIRLVCPIAPSSTGVLYWLCRETGACSGLTPPFHVGQITNEAHLDSEAFLGSPAAHIHSNQNRDVTSQRELYVKETNLFFNDQHKSTAK